MPTAERYLLDKSALARWAKPTVEAVLDDLAERALIAVCGPIEYEVLFSARNAAEADRLRHLLFGFDYVSCGDEVWDRVREVQAEAMNKGFHRCLSPADVLIAAIAERHGLTVLHYDRDYDMIATVTGQPMRWVAEPGTAD